MSTVRPGVMQKQERQVGATGEIVNVKPEISKEDIRIELKAVSYTHLDVYKRQAAAPAFWGAH